MTDQPPASPEGSRAQMDRRFSELLQELRVGQTGVQLLFGFLLAIPFTSRYSSLDHFTHQIFEVTVLFATLALGFLMAPVLVHRWNFRRHVRPEIINVSHVLTVVGLYLLMLAVIGSVSVVAAVAVPGQSWLVGLAAGGLIALWVVVPAVVRLRRPDNDHPPLIPGFSADESR